MYCVHLFVYRVRADLTSIPAAVHYKHVYKSLTMNTSLVIRTNMIVLLQNFIKNTGAVKM